MHEQLDRFMLEIMGRNTRHNRQIEQDFIHGVDEEEQDRDFNITLPYSDLEGVWYNEDSNLSKASSSLPIWRLNDVKQLGYLINLGGGKNFDNFFIEPFSHTRVNHSLIVGMVTERILRRNKIDERDILIAEAAGALHDIATPAGGDATKSVDKKNLDEEDFWWEVIEDKGWQYLESIGATRQQIDDIVHNRGLLGKILDISDKITYVMHDLFAYMGGGVFVPTGAPTLRGYNDELQKLIFQDTALGDIYKTVNIDKESEQIYFTDPEKLRKFLELRAVLHADIYLNWASQGRDMLAAELLRPFYSEKPGEGKLTPHDLRRMGDSQLNGFLGEKYGKKGFGKSDLEFLIMLEKFKPEIETFETMEEAEKMKQKLEENPDLVVLGTKHVRRFKTGVDFLVKDENGEILPFSEHDRVCSQRIEDIAASTENIFVFYAKASAIPRPLKAS